MTVSAQVSYKEYTGNGSTTAYSYPYKVLAATDLKVYTVVIATGAETLQTQGGGGTYDYAVSVAGDNNSATVTLNNNLPSTHKVFITRVMDLSQTVDITSGDAFSATSIETALDKIELKLQQHDEELTRALKFKKSTATRSEPDIPELAANKVIKVNAAGNGFETQSTVDIETIAGISSDVTTVSGIASNVTTVAADGSDIGTVAGAISNVNSVGGSISNVNTVASNISAINTNNSNSTNINTVAGIDSNITTVAGIASNVTTVAGIASNVTAVAGDATDIGAVAGKATEIGRLGTADAVADMALLGTSANVTNQATLAGIASNITTVAGISSNVTSVAGDATDIGTVAGISSNVTSVAGIASNVTSVAGNATNVNTVAGAITNVNNVGGSIANVNTVAGNLSGVNSFGERYRVGSSYPASSNDAGDLAFNTSAATFGYYDGSSWQSIVAGGISSLAGDATPQLGGDLDLNSNDITGTGNINTTGNLTISGDLTVNGTTTTINSTTMTVDDKNLVLASGAADSSAADGSGITIDGASAELKYVHSGTKWTVNKDFDVTGNIIVSGTVDGRDLQTDGTKLDAIEASADVTDATNVTAAGALMDSEVTNLAEVKAFAAADYATAAQGTLATNALPKAGGDITGTLGVINPKDLGIGIHIKESDSGAGVNGHCDQLIIEHGASGEGCGMSLLAATDGFGKIAFGDSGDNDIGSIIYNNTGNSMTFITNAANALVIDSSGNGTFTGNVTAYSDERLKSDIKTIDNALDKVSQMRGVSFTKDDKKGSGVIAQELEKIAPELVTDGEYKSVAYGNIVGYLIEAIKELKAEVKQLKESK